MARGEKGQAKGSTKYKGSDAFNLYEAPSLLNHQNTEIVLSKSSTVERGKPGWPSGRWEQEMLASPGFRPRPVRRPGGRPAKQVGRAGVCPSSHK